MKYVLAILLALIFVVAASSQEGDSSNSLCNLYGISCDDDEESDSQFIKKLKKWYETKGKNILTKAKNTYNDIKPILDALAADKKKPAEEEPVEEEADAQFLKKLKKWYENKGKNILNKAKNTYNNIKPILDALAADKKKAVEEPVEVPEVEAPENDEATEADSLFLEKLKSWFETKGKEFIERAKTTAKPIAEALHIKVDQAEDDDDNTEQPAEQEEEQEEADSLFLKKLKKWYDNKGKNILNKAKNTYNNIKPILDALAADKKKPAEEEPVEEEADAQFIKKLKKWYDNKGKNILNKVKNTYNDIKPILDALAADKKKAEEPAPEEEVEGDFEVEADLKIVKKLLKFIEKAQNTYQNVKPIIDAFKNK